ncbi:cobalamin-dependent protein [Erythrobacter sp. SDW2]|uniref:cobalamin B12-binding domain-containing protein n=1 Tax=Erythrobacter sp. SDW2 TaxID=2907154 RepID=UPI001EEBE6F7|nr:cobalamin-dependent protein [Erythrobacter sp. SDW2]UIP06893.1 cobalamin-dependent protein [Erythrobacter sp. SDW2]
MASVFGISALRTRFDDWRSSFWKPDLGEDLPHGPEVARLTVVEEPIDLSALIERLVIPRLLANEKEQGHPAWSGPHNTANAANTLFPVSDDDVTAFAKLAIAGEAATLLDFIDDCLTRGSSVEHIYVDLLAPAARKLGTMWEDDQRDFIDVTMGLWRIQEVLRELGHRVPHTSSRGRGPRMALFSTMPGDQHSLGTLMICECFERAGWSAEPLIEPSTSDLLGKLAGRHFDLVGLTVSNDCPTAALSSLVSSIRSVSSNPGIRVMVGGRLINEQPELAVQCGADATATDAMAALEMANFLVSAVAEAPSPLS